MCLAIPGAVLSIGSAVGPLRAGRVDFGGVIREINLAYTPEARVGDYVLVHVGFAISVIDESEARRIFALLRELGEAQAAGGEEP
jgi:hydrogenase expression/formation protein HypC